MPGQIQSTKAILDRSDVPANPQNEFADNLVLSFLKCTSIEHFQNSLQATSSKSTLLVISAQEKE
jgi:hypothetical protein